jgi:hypothetical protein
MNEIEKQINNVCSATDCYFLQKASFEFHDLKLLGCTLWTDIPQDMEKYVRERINDYNHVSVDNKRVTPAYITQLHQDHKSWIQRELNSQPDIRTIVMTHHLPSYKLIASEFQSYEVLNLAFASNLDKIIQKPIVSWICGHSHRFKRMKINDIDVILNPLARPQEVSHCLEDLEYNLPIINTFRE